MSHLSYNYDYDIAAMVLVAVVLFIFLIHKHIKNSTSRLFYVMIMFAFLTRVFDILGGESIVRQYPYQLVHLINNLYYLTEQATNLVFLIYVISMLEMEGRITRLKKMLMVVPFLVTAFVIITNPMHGLLYKYGSDCVWISGPFRLFIVALPIFYFAWAAIFMLANSEVIEKPDRILIFDIAIINCMARLIQFYYPSLLIYSFAVSIGMLILLIGFHLNNKKIDPETGFANRTYMAEATRKYMYNKVPFSTIFVRIADYDLLTTGFGIRVTDEYVRNIAHDIGTLCGGSEMFQLNNSCFSVILTNKSGDEINVLKRKIADILDKPFMINGLEMISSYFVSSIAYPEQVAERDAYVSYMTYFQSMNGAQYGVLDADDLQIKNKKREVEVEKAIERAIKNNSFDVYYQPICVTGTQEFVTAEALVRLIDPELGFISPAEFIPLSESNGMIIPIGNIVLEKVCQFIAEHDLDDLGLRSIEMNLSTTQCLQSNFIDVVRKMVKKYEIEPRTLSFEITETASAYAPTIFTENLATLHADGHFLILDDFGSGYSNLQRLVSTDFDIIKFDKDMIQKTCSDKKLYQLFERMQNIFHSMGAQIVAEGVETKEQYELLMDFGCDYIQGYYFSKALRTDKFIEFLNEHRTPRAAEG